MVICFVLYINRGRVANHHLEKGPGRTAGPGVDECWRSGECVCGMARNVGSTDVMND